MTDDAFDTVLVPVLRELREHLVNLVVIGGWVPELHRRFGTLRQWAVRPLRTTEVDILVPVPKVAPTDVESLAATLARAGFTPLGREGASAVWERNPTVGERIEFFVEHRGAWGTLNDVRPIEPRGRLGALGLSDVGILRERSVELAVPINENDAAASVVMVRVPELGSFLVHKGATFRRRTDPVKRAKDLQYVVDVMRSSDAVVDALQRQVSSYCAEGGEVAALTRTARNQVSLVVHDPGSADLRLRLGEALSVRDGISPGEGDARARGYLTDFVEMVPEACGDGAR